MSPKKEFYKVSFPVSPGVQVNEYDATTVIPNIATSMGAFAGVFRWGPVYERILVDSENSLVNLFQKPTNFNAESWFTVANFNAYGGVASVVRCANLTSTNTQVSALTAVANVTSVSNALNLIVANHDDYATKDGTFETSSIFVAKWPGEVGNSLRVSECFSTNNYKSSVNLATFGLGATLTMNVGSNVATMTVTDSSTANANTSATTLVGLFSATDILEMGNTGPNGIGIQYMKISSIGSVSSTGNTSSGTATFTLNMQDILQLHTAINVATSVTRYWEFFSAVGVAPGQSTYQSQFGNTSAQDEMHVVIVDDGGKFSGVPGSVLEVYRGVSRATDGQTFDGQTNYYKNVINKQSQYVWFTNDYANAVSNTALLLASATATAPLTIKFNGGADGASEANVAPSVIAKGYDMFASKEDVMVDLVMCGKGIGGIDGTQTSNYVLDNIVGTRKDCVAFVSPSYADVVNNPGQEMVDILSFRNNSRSSSYGFMDSGYKYMYDRYNDIYRYVPMNGDMAGLAAQCDRTNDAWWSFAGFNRGNIKNIVRLAYNPRQAERDQLYPQSVNPVVTFQGQGTILYGDRTMLTKPSAFDRVNVRRLFIVLERAISTAAQYSLFEFNDTFTRSAFKNMVNPYLRDVKGRRGLTDFLVVCDETNNTAQVINSNQFVGDIYVRPNYSINFIRLNFVAVPNGVQFNEIVGQFG